MLKGRWRLDDLDIQYLEWICESYGIDNYHVIQYKQYARNHK